MVVLRRNRSLGIARATVSDSILKERKIFGLLSNKNKASFAFDARDVDEGNRHDLNIVNSVSTEGVIAAAKQTLATEKMNLEEEDVELISIFGEMRNDDLLSTTTDDISHDDVPDEKISRSGYLDGETLLRRPALPSAPREIENTPSKLRTGIANAFVGTYCFTFHSSAQHVIDAAKETCVAVHDEMQEELATLAADESLEDEEIEELRAHSSQADDAESQEELMLDDDGQEELTLDDETQEELATLAADEGEEKEIKEPRAHPSAPDDVHSSYGCGLTSVFEYLTDSNITHDQDDKGVDGYVLGTTANLNRDVLPNDNIVGSGYSNVEQFNLKQILLGHQTLHPTLRNIKAGHYGAYKMCSRG